MKTSTLVDMLEIRGWGALNSPDMKGVRATLRAVIHCLPYGSAEGYATAPQVAHKAGYSRKWVERCLHTLEDVGLITWRRGGVYHGEPVPGYMRVNKDVLADMVNQALAQCQAEVQAARVAMRKRLERYKPIRYIAPKTRKPHPLKPVAPQGKTGSSQWEVGRYPSPPKGGESPNGGSRPLNPSASRRPAIPAQDGPVTSLPPSHRGATRPRGGVLPWQDHKPATKPTQGMLTARAALAALGRSMT